MKSGSISFASDKALYDALYQHKFKNEDLRELFFNRGIIHSKKTERDLLALHFSRLNHDYYDHQKIASVLGVVNSKERSSSEMIKIEIDDQAIEKSVNALVAHCKDKQDSVTFSHFQGGYEIRVNYEHLDYAKTEFKQVTTKDAVIQVEKHNDTLVIRGPDNEYTSNLKKILLDKVQASVTPSDYEAFNIELKGVKDPDLITKFFLKLIGGMEGTNVVSVLEVSVYNPDEDDDSGIYVQNVNLKGKGISNSTELRDLFKKGFHIVKITWTAKSDHVKSDLYTFEAQFNEPKEKTKFSYIVRGMQRYKEDGEFNKTRQPVTALDDLTYSRKMENAARNAINELFPS